MTTTLYTIDPPNCFVKNRKYYLVLMYYFFLHTAFYLWSLLLPKLTLPMLRNRTLHPSVFRKQLSVLAAVASTLSSPQIKTSPRTLARNNHGVPSKCAFEMLWLLFMWIKLVEFPDDLSSAFHTEYWSEKGRVQEVSWARWCHWQSHKRWVLRCFFPTPLWLCSLAYIQIFIMTLSLLDVLCLVLVELYEEAEKPHDAMEFIKSQMQVGGDDEVASLKRELETTRAENEAVRIVFFFSSKVYFSWNVIFWFRTLIFCIFRCALYIRVQLRKQVADLQARLQ